MSDDLEIRGGGAVAVDTASLDAAAARTAGLAALLDQAAAEVRRAVALLDLAGLAWAAGEPLARRAEACAATARELGRALREAAAVYELVEAHAQRAAAAGDAAEAARLDARIAALAEAHPGADAVARRAAAEAADGWDDEFLLRAGGGAFVLGPLAAPAALGLGGLVAAAIGRAARERSAAGLVLRGDVAPPPMTATARGTAAAPATLAELAARIPPGPDRVRVERYAMPDGARRYAVYVGGTQGWAGAEPWDMASNARLYLGVRSDSAAATAAALTAAGARPGDVVYAAGHSQGAMIAGHLAAEGGYDARLLATFGSPVEAAPAPGTLSVRVRHRDDPVALLAGAGAPVPAGAAGGFLAERTVGAAGPADVLGAHALATYEETARRIDASADPRAAHLHDVLAELSGAEADVVTWAPAVSGRSAADGG